MCGISESDWWEMTPREFEREVNAHAGRQDQANYRIAFLAATVMNASGRYKNTIEPEGLLKGGASQKPTMPLDELRRRMRAVRERGNKYGPRRPA